jgi:hypothetical protein
MKKLLLLVGLVAGVLLVSSGQEAKAGCGCGVQYGVAYPSYSYRPVYTPVYSVPTYGYTNYGYAPAYSGGAYYGGGYYQPGLSVVIGSGYRGYGYGSYSSYGGGYGYHHHSHW